MKLEILHRAPKRNRGRAPILFVHGAYSAAWIWQEHYLAFFAAKGYPAYALSLRGHGGSEGDLASASFRDYVDDVEAAIKTIQGEPILIGHSMGGLIIQHYVSRGGKARALVLLASAPPSGLRSSALHMTVTAPDVLLQLALLQSLGPAWTTPAIISRALFSSESTPQSKTSLMHRLQRESPRAAAEMLTPPILASPPAEEKPPVLVLGGDADIFLPRSAMQELADFWQGDLEVLEGAPHGLMVDTVWRDVAAEKIFAWLEAHVARWRQ